MLKSLILISSIVGLSGALSLPSNYDDHIDNAQTISDFIPQSSYSEYAIDVVDNNNLHYVYAAYLNNSYIYSNTGDLLNTLNDFNYYLVLKTGDTNFETDILQTSISTGLLIGGIYYYPILQIYNSNTEFLRLNVGFDQSRTFIDFQFYCTRAFFVEQHYLYFDFLQSSDGYFLSVDDLEYNYEFDNLIFSFNTFNALSISIRNDITYLQNKYTTEGFNDGYNSGFDNGFNAGYTQGANSGQSLGNLFMTIADIPIRTIYSLFNFDLFGMSVFVAIMSIVTLILVVYVIRKIV